MLHRHHTRITRSLAGLETAAYVRNDASYLYGPHYVHVSSSGILCEMRTCGELYSSNGGTVCNLENLPCAILCTIPPALAVDLKPRLHLA